MPRRRFLIFILFPFVLCFSRARDTMKGKKALNAFTKKSFCRRWSWRRCRRRRSRCCRSAESATDLHSVFTVTFTLFFLSAFTTCSHRQARTQAHIHKHTRGRRYIKRQKMLALLCFVRPASRNRDRGSSSPNYRCNFCPDVAATATASVTETSVNAVVPSRSSHTTSMSESAAALTT